MPTRLIPHVKVLVHLLALAPLAYLLNRYRDGSLALEADPINYITHFTGDWALWLPLAITPLRRLHPVLSNLIRFRRLVGLYAFFYATLHLATYVFLFSGYDIQTAFAGVRGGRLGEIFTQARLIWPTIYDDVLKRRFIQVGFLAWVILLALAVTSPTWILRAMGGRNWQRLHRLVYVAAGAGCVHYWWLVKKGVRTPLPDTLVLIGLLLARLGWVILKKRRKTA
jgi:sulfoxide reductase heme-binding subunit YedZ